MLLTIHKAIWLSLKHVLSWSVCQPLSLCEHYRQRTCSWNNSLCRCGPYCPISGYFSVLRKPFLLVLCFGERFLGISCLTSLDEIVQFLGKITCVWILCARIFRWKRLYECTLAFISGFENFPNVQTKEIALPFSLFYEKKILMFKRQHDWMKMLSWSQDCIEMKES